MPDFARYLDGRTLILLSNREPYEHAAKEGGVTVKQPAGGLVSALDPTMRRTDGTWVAWGSGSGDRQTADDEGRLRVPPDDPAYTLRRVWLDEADVDGYYLGFANSALWPLCHLLVQHFQFQQEHWERYEAVNRRFAEAVAEETRRADGEAIVWIQDYHFGLVAEQVRALGTAALIHQFWHIPFPPPDILRLLPSEVYEPLLRGMLGNDLLEFHTERYAMNFFDCVAAFIPDVELRREQGVLYYQGRTVSVEAFPISIDVDHYEQLARAESGEARATSLRRLYATERCRLGIGVDRVDYTKGIPERLRALERLWERFDDLCGCLTFVQVATPSRTDIGAYQALEDEVVQTVDRINARFSTDRWTPIVLIRENVDAALLASVYRAADLCLVSSLQDGMNLVAKEFIACQVDERGVLVLSKFTGAAEEIDGAVLVNPFNVDGFVEGIRQAVDMPDEERQERMRRMRAQLRGSTIFDWLEAILSRVDTLLRERADPPPVVEVPPLAGRDLDLAGDELSRLVGDGPEAGTY